jgi:uncharacterized DUF497 family protein
MLEAVFEWDPRKSRSNLRKHGIDFDEARAVFFDPLRRLDMEGHEHGEIRWRTIGEINGSLYAVFHTLEDEGEIEVTRIISARKVSRRERRAYERQA